MDGNESAEQARRTLERTYRRERPRFVARLRAAGRTLEEAEDIVQDVYAESVEKLWLLPRIANPAAWITTRLKRRVIDLWRHERVREKRGEVDVAEETLREVIAGAGLDPLDSFVRQSLSEALNTAIHALPAPQRRVVEAQVFGGRTFREISEATGESIDTLTARKRYAVEKLALALRHWLDD
jgi:RNA polymerase sigma factor (sigma-70 family)